jgi:hypothetical protein
MIIISKNRKNMGEEAATKDLTTPVACLPRTIEALIRLGMEHFGPHPSFSLLALIHSHTSNVSKQKEFAA